MSDDFELDTDDLKRRMDGAMANLKTEFASLRTGRASASMLEPVMVDAYGSQTPINQVGTVNVPEPRMVTINVWDKGLVGKVEKAIRSGTHIVFFATVEAVGLEAVRPLMYHAGKFQRLPADPQGTRNPAQESAEALAGA